MLLCEKLELLRSLEGNLRGLNRPLTKSEVVRLIGEEHDGHISLAYLSQLESGKRQHMTAKSRELLASFFKVHPGYLVNDPEGFRTDLATIGAWENRLDDWLQSGAASFQSHDPEVADAMRLLASSDSTRDLLLVMGRIASDSALVEKLKAAFGGKARAKQSDSDAEGEE